MNATVLQRGTVNNASLTIRDSREASVASRLQMGFQMSCCAKRFNALHRAATIKLVMEYAIMNATRLGATLTEAIAPWASALGPIVLLHSGAGSCSKTRFAMKNATLPSVFSMATIATNEVRYNPAIRFTTPTARATTPTDGATMVATLPSAIGTALIVSKNHPCWQ